MTVTYKTFEEAYNQAVQHLRDHPSDKGWFVCQRKKDEYVLWPTLGLPPKSYRIVEEVPQL